MKVKIGDVVKDNESGLLYIVVDVCGIGPNSTYATVHRIILYPNGFCQYHIHLNSDHTIKYPERWKNLDI